MKFDRSSLQLYAVTDSAWLGGCSLSQVVEQALQGGVTLVQLREKDLERCWQEAEALLPLCRRYQVPLIINDYVDIALSCDADGVHVGQSDRAAGLVRAELGKDKILGVSVQSVEQARLAVEQGADYLGVGAVFPTSTKLDADAVSLETLQKICSCVPIPVCAIGGISRENIMGLKGSGIAGVALVSAIFAQDNIEESCRVLGKLAREISI